MPLTADNTTVPKIKQIYDDGYYTDLPVAAAETIYKWSFVGMDADGYLVSYKSPTVGLTIVGGDLLMGIAMEHVDNSAGADGAKRCRVFTYGFFEYAVSGMAVTDVGSPLYASNDATLTQSCLGNAYMGNIVALESSGNVVVQCQPHVGHLGPNLTVRTSPVMLSTALNTVRLVHPQENGAGCILQFAYGIAVVADAGGGEDQSIWSFNTTTPAVIGTVASADASADAAGNVRGLDTIGCPIRVLDLGAVATEVVQVVGAGLGVNVIATQATAGNGAAAAGSWKFVIGVTPIL